jgi:hypothetical protein
MNEPTQAEWQELARLWKTGIVPVAVEDIEKCHLHQRRKILAVTTVELTAAVLGVAAALWLMFVPRFHGVGIVIAAFALGSSFVVMRTRRVPVPQGHADLRESLKSSLNYQDWMAEQLRYGRALSFVALFAITIAASVQLLNFASATRPGLSATAVAALAVCAALARNVTLTWQVARHTKRLQSFSEKLAALL